MRMMTRSMVLPVDAPHDDHYYWAHGGVTEVRVGNTCILVGAFPTREQEDSTVYGGRPMMGDVFAVIKRWGLSKYEAIRLMHEEVDEV